MSTHTGEPASIGEAHFLQGLDDANSIHGNGIEGVRHRFAYLARVCMSSFPFSEYKDPVDRLAAIAKELGEAYHEASLPYAEEIRQEVTKNPSIPLSAAQNQQAA